MDHRHDDTIPRLLDREQLLDLIGGRQTLRSFSNWLHRATRDRGFPRPLVVGDRSVRWRASEVAAWLEARPRSDASRSPLARKKRPENTSAARCVVGG